MLFPSLPGNLNIKLLQNAHDRIKIFGVVNVFLQTYRNAAAPLKI